MGKVSATLLISALFLAAGCTAGFNHSPSSGTGSGASAVSPAEQRLEEGLSRYRDGTPEGRKAGFAQIREACDRGLARACTMAGVSYSLGRDVPQSDTEANRLYTKACDGGDSEGCRMLASAYEGGLGVSENPRQAITLYKKSCNMGNPESCLSLGNLLAREGKTADAELAWASSCNKGNPYGCMQRAQSLLKRNPSSREARSLLQVACRQQEEDACQMLKDLTK